MQDVLVAPAVSIAECPGPRPRIMVDPPLGGATGRASVVVAAYIEKAGDHPYSLLI